MTVQQCVSRETECCTLEIPASVQFEIDAKRRGARKNVFHGGLLCSKCLAEPPMKGQRYGKKCHALAMKETRRRKADELARRRQIAAMSKDRGDGRSGNSE